jgi:phage terminase large subunit-like protein
LLAGLPQLEAEAKRRAGRRIDRYYRDSGPLRRELYPKHLEFFRAGREHDSRLFMAGNRCGKTTAGCYETALHATGEYPSWWEGFRFRSRGPSLLWVAGKTAKTTREILELELLGPPGHLGEGMIPRDRIRGTRAKPGVSDAVELVYIEHAGGAIQTLVFKSYDQGRKAFEGGKPRWILKDEEPPAEIDYECRMRLMSTGPDDAGGLSVLTFTPLDGWTEIVEDFAQNAVNKDVLEFTQHETGNFR